MRKPISPPQCGQARKKRERPERWRLHQSCMCAHSPCSHAGGQAARKEARQHRGMRTRALGGAGLHSGFHMQAPRSGDHRAGRKSSVEHVRRGGLSAWRREGCVHTPCRAGSGRSVPARQGWKPGPGAEVEGSIRVRACEGWLINRGSIAGRNQSRGCTWAALMCVYGCTYRVPSKYSDRSRSSRHNKKKRSRFSVTLFSDRNRTLPGGYE